jgi:hypothetical protein
MACRVDQRDEAHRTATRFRHAAQGCRASARLPWESDAASPARSADRHAVPSGSARGHASVRMTEPRWGSLQGGDRGVDAGSPENARYRSALRGCMTQARWAWDGLSCRSTRFGSLNRNAVPACSPRVPSLSEAPLGIRCRLPCPVFGPPRGPVRREARPRGHSNDGTPSGVRPAAGSWGGSGVPGERSLSLGTPGLHDASPLGFEL